MPSRKKRNQMLPRNNKHIICCVLIILTATLLQSEGSRLPTLLEEKKPIFVSSEHDYHHSRFTLFLYGDGVVYWREDFSNYEPKILDLNQFIETNRSPEDAGEFTTYGPYNKGKIEQSYLNEFVTEAKQILREHSEKANISKRYGAPLTTFSFSHSDSEFNISEMFNYIESENFQNEFCTFPRNGLSNDDLLTSQSIELRNTYKLFYFFQNKQNEIIEECKNNGTMEYAGYIETIRLDHE
ncbi:MAG: hypothetical protein SFY68_07020 [Candidatus Sumerlaeia bacterium]|nr:hypothetical protein [Candidatus Sumerlaeia bacterium]